MNHLIVFAALAALIIWGLIWLASIVIDVFSEQPIDALTVDHGEIVGSGREL